MAVFVPIIIAAAFVTIFVFTVLYICHKKRDVEEKRRRRRLYQQQAEANQQRLYTYPHFSPDEVDAVQPLSQVHIHQTSSRHQQQQQQKDDNGFTYTHPSESKTSIHRLNAADNNQDDNRRAAANMLSDVSVQQQQQQQQPQTSPPSPQHQRNRPVNLPQTSPSLRPSYPFHELAPLPVVYQQGSSRRNLDRINNNTPASPSFSPKMQPQVPAELTSGSREDSDGDNVRRAATSYHAKHSHLPRPLHLRRPIVTDTSITPSSKVVATIGRGVPMVVQDDDSNSPIEPPVVIIGKSPVLMALGANMLSHTSSSASAASPKATPPAKSTARRESIRRTAAKTTTTTTQTPTQTQASHESQTQTQTQTHQTPHHQGIIRSPTPIAENHDSIDEFDENPFMSKEEFRRPAPQAILPEGFKHAQFTLPLLPLPPQMNKVVDSSDDEVAELDTGRLVLEPYLSPAELAAHVPFPVPAVAPEFAKESASSADQTIGQNSTPTRPPRRAPDAADQLNLSQSKFQAQRQANPVQSIHPLAPSADAPWSSSQPATHRSASPSPPSNLPLFSPSSPSPPPSPSPSPTPSSLSNKSSSTNNTRVKPPPPALPPPRGSRSGSTSQSGSERGMSPAPSLSNTSSNISTGLSIISSLSGTIVTDVSSFVSLGDTPTTTASMFCASPTYPPVLSSTIPAASGRTFSVSTAGSPATPRLPPGQSPPIVVGEDDYSWIARKFDNNSDDDENGTVVVRQAKKTRVPEAVGGGTRLSYFNYDT